MDAGSTQAPDQLVRIGDPMVALYLDLLRVEGEYSAAKLNVRLSATWKGDQHVARVRVTSPLSPIIQEEIEMVFKVLDCERYGGMHLSIENDGIEISLP